MSNAKDKISSGIREIATDPTVRNTDIHSKKKQSSPYKEPNLPSLSLPKGGGSIRGIGEKFAVSPVTGTGSITIPVYSSPGRSGFGPSLSLSYDSGSGNGPFGFGWSMSIPSITRKTDKGLPKYQDADKPDTFILSGSEDLVPVLVQDGDGKWKPTEVPIRKVKGVEYKIELYCPRIEGLFARIERWTNLQTGEIHWRSISKDNITTIYGKSLESRIADPTDPIHRIFSWLICESYDDRGNIIIYNYKAENSQGVVDLSLINELNRSDLTRSSNRYLKRIKYGNKTPHKVDNEDPFDEGLEQRLQNDWMFEVVFDYGEQYFEDRQSHPPISVFIDDDQPQQRPWQLRQDPFSSYRGGFEVRTYRLCRRVLMFHHFPDENGLGVQDYLVKSTEFTYGESPVASFLTRLTQSGYILKNDKYLKKSLPPLEFGYSGLSSKNNDQEADVISLGFEFNPSAIQDKIQEINDAESLQNLPYGLDGIQYQWVDLEGEGISGILTEQAGAWFYKHNISSLPLTGPDGKVVLDTKGKPVVVPRFGPLTVKTTIPSFSDLTRGSTIQHQLMDITGEGIPDLVKFDRFISGYFKRSSSVDTENWETFTPFPSQPNISWNDPNMRFIDLTGGGHADVLITEDQAFTWYPSLAEKGFGKQSQRIYQPLDEEKGPRLVFAEVTQSIYLADMSGDGLVDLVRIRNGEVCYWPNLGYGNFGAKVTLQNSSHFDMPELFDPRRIRLADLDGSGTTDIIYLGCDGIHLYFNLSGNTLSIPQTLNTQFPHIDQLSSVMAVDLFGNGTSCLVWSSPLPGDTDRPMRYIDFMRGQKPHLLVSVINNMGAETKIQYAPSTKFYLNDKIRGQPWITKLPFPVQVVERVETYDRISQNMFVTRYSYHHGYFDPTEREFRGFGMVEQFDTEEFASLSNPNESPLSPTNVEKSSHIPPVKTKTWFHTGAYLDGHSISKQFEYEYYREPALSDEEYHNKLLSDSVILTPKKTIITADEEREAFRALKGSILRQEIYAMDGIPNKSEHPYSVSERNYTVNLLQPRQQIGNNQHAVLLVSSREKTDYNYERNPDDLRLSHTLTLKVDEFGNVVRSASVSYGRSSNGQDPNLSPQDKIKQSQVLITCTQNSFTNPIVPIKPDNSDGDIYRTPLPCESNTYELTGLNPVIGNRFDFAIIDQAITNATQIDYQEKPSLGGGLQKRLIDHSCILYRKDSLDGPLPLGEVQTLGLIYETYRQAFTPGLVSQVYGNRVTDSMLLNEGRYVHFKKDLASGDEDPNWWIPSGRIFYSPNENDTPASELNFAQTHFFLPHRFRDPFHNDTTNRKDSKLAYDQHNLLIQETRDPLDNVVTVVTKDQNGRTIIAFDYRVLQPWMITDPNDNRSAVAFDILGLVVGTAVMGKIEENNGDSLDGFDPNLDEVTIISHIKNPLTSNSHGILNKATTCLIYDLFQYKRSSETPNTAPMPNVVYSLIRETHESDLVPSVVSGGQTSTIIQHRFSYSDGFGREIQIKIQAEPGKIDNNDSFQDHRWIGSEWTIFNNKGKPVKKYEPFFSDTHQFQFAKIVGVSSTLFYDPLERVVATLNPNHTYEKVVFDNWNQESWDVNDTILQTDPKNDISVKGFFERLPDTEYLKTWYEDRKNGQKGPKEQDASEKASEHANTPSVSYFDSLGRTFLTIADNGSDGKYNTRVELDVEGNQLEVKDALDRKVMTYSYDMLGNKVRQTSMDAGERWMLHDVSIKPIYRWDSRNHIIRMTYDQLQRPREVFLREVPGTDRLVELTVYGEAQGKTLNHRGKIFRHLDGAGVVTNKAFDFKGNLLNTTRQLAADYKNTLDWITINSVKLEAQIFTVSTTFDALNRPITITTPDNSISHYGYDKTNLLKKLEVDLHGQTPTTTFIDDVNYNAKGQRASIKYGNGIVTDYKYDDLTFRLIHLNTKRGSENLQDLSFTYDPAGNITDIKDDSQQTIFFRNQRVEPSSDYTYDAIYRLVMAKGREHLGQTNGALSPPTPTSHTDSPRVNLLHPNDGNLMSTYCEQYLYDEVGNIKELSHNTKCQPSSPGWSRTYTYETSNNHLSNTTVNGISDNYAYDSHGNIIHMPHLPLMLWDFRDQLLATSQQKVQPNKTPITTYYVYNSSGQRVRKVTESEAQEGQDPKRQKERIYLGGLEIYREYNGNNGNTVKLERETFHVMDNKQRIAIVETRTQGNDDSLQRLIRYQVGNHLGSATMELDQHSQLISYEEYYSYGSTSYQAVRRQTETPKRYRYTGKERDEESGLSYHGARYYAQWLARWASSDPIGISDGLNCYEYVHGNPIKMIDLTGQNGELLPGGVGDRTAEVLASGGKPEMERDLPGGAKQGEPALDQEAAQNVEPPKPKPSPKHEPTSRPKYREPTIDTVSDEEVNRQKMDKLLMYELPPEKTGYLGEDYFAYAFVYGLKQTIYNPIKSWITDERPRYLDSEGRVQTISFRPDRSGELAVAFGQIALSALPMPKGANAAPSPQLWNPAAGEEVFVGEWLTRNLQLQQDLNVVSVAANPQSMAQLVPPRIGFVSISQYGGYVMEYGLANRVQSSRILGNIFEHVPAGAQLRPGAGGFDFVLRREFSHWNLKPWDVTTYASIPRKMSAGKDYTFIGYSIDWSKARF